VKLFKVMFCSSSASSRFLPILLPLLLTLVKGWSPQPMTQPSVLSVRSRRKEARNRWSMPHSSNKQQLNHNDNLLLKAEGGQSVSSFVKNLDSVLGNPGSSTPVSAGAGNTVNSVASSLFQQDSATSMTVSTPTILIAGGLFSLSLAGFAFYLSLNNDDDGSSNEQLVANETYDTDSILGGVVRAQSVIDMESNVEKLESEKVQVEAELEQVESIVTDMQSNFEELESEEKQVETKLEQVESEKEQLLSKSENVESEKEQVEAKANLEKLESVKEQLLSTKEEVESKKEEMAVDKTDMETTYQTLKVKAEELELKVYMQQVELEDEKLLRKDIETKLEASAKTNEELEEKYNQEVNMRISQTEELEKAKSQFRKEQLLRKETDSNLSTAAELNRVLEDKYELEQNVVKRSSLKLEETQSTLDDSEKSLAKTSNTLKRVKGELQDTHDELKSKSDSLEKLEEERKSLRKIGKNAWHLSKTRFRNRFNKVGGRFKRSKKTDEEDGIEYDSDGNFQ